MALIKGRRVCYFPSGGQSRQHGWLLRGVLQNGSFRLSVFRMGRMPPPTVRDEGGRSPSEPQSTRHGSALRDNGELRHWKGQAFLFVPACVDRVRSVCRLRSGPPYRTRDPMRSDKWHSAAAAFAPELHSSHFTLHTGAQRLRHIAAASLCRPVHGKQLFELSSLLYASVWYIIWPAPSMAGA